MSAPLCRMHAYGYIEVHAESSARLSAEEGVNEVSDAVQNASDVAESDRGDCDTTLRNYIRTRWSGRRAP